jgi:hydroxymethylpyrimidine/phosphomethylpyrimidine kinase
MQLALSIAGSDPSGGAGIQADLKTFFAHGVYGMAVLTLLTAQSTRGVTRVEVMAADLVEAQLETLLADLAPNAIKTGALGSAEVTRTVARVLRERGLFAVVDPVMISKHGAPLLPPDATGVILAELAPRARVLMPNAHEAAALTGRPVRTLAEAKAAARELLQTGARAVVVKGGHLSETAAIDVVAFEDEVHELSDARVDSTSTHGTGCTYSAAVAARLGQGAPLLEAVAGAKQYVRRAIASAPGLGHGVGPLNHFVPWE